MRKFLSRIYYKTPFTYHYFINKELKKIKVNSILDVGCGKGNSITRIEKAMNARLVGIDAHRGSVEEAKKTGIYEEIFHKDITKLSIRDRSFDVVFFISVIEHLTEEDGRNVLDKLERIAKKGIIVLTPNGYLPGEEFDGNPYQEHKSGNWFKEFKKRGYKIRGMDGLKILNFGRFNPIITVLTEPFVYFLPKYATSLIAIKRLDN